MINVFIKMLCKRFFGLKMEDRDLGIFLSLKISDVGIVNLKFKESVNFFKLYINFYVCLFFCSWNLQFLLDSLGVYE